LSLTASCASCFALLMGQEFIAWTALVAVAFLCAQLELFGHREWAMVKDRLAWPRWRGKAARQIPSPKRRQAGDLAMGTTNDTGTRRKQLEGVPQAQPSLPLGINVRLVGARSASTASAGKKYVELFS
jgi:hypothetical protein